MRERDDAAAERRRRGRRPTSWRGHPLGHARVDGEHVPVERPRRRGGHAREQLDLVVGELVEAAVDDRLERRALVVARPRRTARAPRPRSPSATRPACRRRRSACSTAWSRSRARRPRSRPRARATIACDLVVGRLAADRVGAHHVAADRAVPDEEPGVDPDAALEPAEVLAEGLPVPVDALLERGERHALDLRHHPAQVVGVLGVQRREREAAVAADDAS